MLRSFFSKINSSTLSPNKSGNQSQLQRSIQRKIVKSKIRKSIKNVSINRRVAGKKKSKIPVRRRVSKQKTVATIVISPEKTQRRSHSDSESNSDIEIIENVTPIIELDDDFDEDDKQIETTAAADPTILSINDTIADNTNTSTDPSSEANSSVEPQPLFFVDKLPGNDFTAPIYELIPGPSNNNNDENMATKPKNIRITFQNKENQPNHENSFAPNPMLSSTRVNMELDECNESNIDSTPKPTNFCISINSSNDGTPSRRVNVGKSPVPTQSPKNGSDEQPLNSNNIVITSSSNNASKSNKRKASKDKQEEPPSKKNNSAADVIIDLNDTVSDGEESVIFVSETMDHQNRTRIKNTLRGKALDFISLGNGNVNQNKSPKSTRAKRKQERKKAENQRQAQAKLNNAKGRHPKDNFRNGKSRFEVKNANTSFDSSAPSTPNPELSNKAVKKNIAIEYDKEKKLFAEKPELFEKRKVIIDGSNVARMHGVRGNVFSVKGIELCMKYFEDRGFTVRVVVPIMRFKRNFSTDPDALERIRNAGKLVPTPCKNLPGQRSTSYDDRFIIELAEKLNGAVISNDNFADLLQEKEEWDEIIKERVIGFSWCDDIIMIPQDPYGRNGRSLQLILHKLKDDAQIDDSTVAPE